MNFYNSPNPPDPSHQWISIAMAYLCWGWVGYPWCQLWYSMLIFWAAASPSYRHCGGPRSPSGSSSFWWGCWKPSYELFFFLSNFWFYELCTYKEIIIMHGSYHHFRKGISPPPLPRGLSSGSTGARCPHPDRSLCWRSPCRGWIGRRCTRRRTTARNPGSPHRLEKYQTNFS